MSEQQLDKPLEIDDCWNRIGIWRREGEPCPRLAELMHCHNCEVYSQSGRRMLERALDAPVRAEFTRIYAEPPAAARTHNRSVLIFRLGDEWLGLDSRSVDEITGARPVQRLPHMPGDLIRGLVNLRGELQLCVSLGGLLGLERGDHKPRMGSVGIGDRMIQIQRDGRRYVFPVTEVHGLHRYHDSELRSPPATLSKARGTYTRGVLTWREAQVGLLDDELIFHSLERSLG